MTVHGDFKLFYVMQIELMYSNLVSIDQMYTVRSVCMWLDNIAIATYGCRVEIEFAFKINHKSCL